MDLMLSGQGVIVTGAGSNIGRAIALAFAGEGARVAVVDIDAARCERVAGEARSGGAAQAIGCPTDVTDIDSVTAMVGAVEAAFGRIDVLVNNAGMSPLAPSSHETSEELFDKVVSVNWKGPFRLASTVAARMRDAGGGVIINVSSSGALRPTPSATPYCGAKAALNVMTECFALEYGPTVRVNTISAGPFLTDISKAWPAAARERWSNPLGRPGRPEEIVTTALYLASPMSSFTTGAMVRCDGGLP